MKKIKIILLSILILIPLFFGCKRQVPDGQVDVSGRFIGGGGKPLYFSIIHPKELEPLDSCTLNEEGSFKVRYLFRNHNLSKFILMIQIL